MKETQTPSIEPQSLTGLPSKAHCAIAVVLIVGSPASLLPLVRSNLQQQGTAKRNPAAGVLGVLGLKASSRSGFTKAYSPCGRFDTKRDFLFSRFRVEDQPKSSLCLVTTN